MTGPAVFSTGSLYIFGLERVFRWAAEVRFDGIEVMMDDRWGTHQPAYLTDLSRRHGLPILALHPLLYGGVWPLGSEERLVRSARRPWPRGSTSALSAWSSSPGRSERRTRVWS